MWKAVAVVVLVLAAPTLAGCLGQGRGAPPERTDDPAGQDPWPRGDGSEWPPDLHGPFKLREVQHLGIPSFDGTPLESYLYIPDLPSGVKGPVVLWSQPYLGGCASNWVMEYGDCAPAGDDPWVYEGNYRVHVRKLVEHGYTVAVVNVRGSGNSGGCLELGGIDEQRDQAFLVEWLGKQPWSNGRVGMYGHSYHGWTPWMAAVQAPPALKTIVASGIVTDPYTFSYGPEGAGVVFLGPFWLAFEASVDLLPPLGGGLRHATVDHLGVLPDRLCPDVAKAMTETGRGEFTDARDEAFWQERRLIPRFADVRAAVLVSQGLNDDTGHTYQEDIVWNNLPHAPKRMVLGQWGHDLPPPRKYLERAPFGSDWHEDVLMPWLDFWLKGLGPGPPRLGIVDYQDSAYSWHTSSAWPPVEAREEALYFGDGALVAEPPGGQHALRAAPNPTVGLCPLGPVASLLPPPALLFASAPLERPATLAGNPLAYLDLGSDQPGGVVAVDVFDLDPGFRCDANGDGMHHVAGGAADLRFYQGNFRGEPFPTGAPAPVRVDIWNDAWVFAPGHRVGVVVSGGATTSRFGEPFDGVLLSQVDQPYFPQLVLHEDAGPASSHIVLPLVEGSLGGSAPTLPYPPRPFDPSAGT